MFTRLGEYFWEIYDPGAKLETSWNNLSPVGHLDQSEAYDMS